MTFVLDWKAKLSYKADPFSEQPGTNVHDFFVDREKERELLNLFVIKQGKLGIIRGAKGSGKSTLLAWLKAELLQHKQIDLLFFDDEKLLGDKTKFTHALLDPHLSLYERTVSKPHQTKNPEEHEALIAGKLSENRHLIVIDNGNSLAKENQQLLANLIGKCAGLQVIVALERVLKEHELIGEDALGIELEPMDDEGLAELLTKRISLVSAHAPFPFDDAELKNLVVASKGSPTKLLAIARDRAIELSLKVDTPTQPAKQEKEQKSMKEKERREPAQSVPESLPTEFPEEQKKKWFSFRIVKTEDKVVFGKKKQQPAEESVPHESETTFNDIDADLLEKVLSDAEKQNEPARSEKKELKKVEPKAEKKDDQKAVGGIIKGGRRR